MASDLGFTTCELSPSASFSSTGRSPPRVEWGASARRRNPAATPASRESAGTEEMSAVTFGSCGAVMDGVSLSGILILQDQGPGGFRAKKLEKRKKIRPGLSKGSPPPV